MHKMVKMVVLSSVLLGSLATTTVSTVSAKAQFQPESVPVFINGEKLKVNGQSAYIRNGSTLVPMRSIFEALNATVTWDNKTQSVTATKGNKTIKLTIDSTMASIDGHDYMLKATPELYNNTTMVPARFVAEALMAKVTWDSANQQVLITSYDKLDALDKKVVDVVNEVTTPNMTDFQKIYALHKYIVNHVEYDYLNYSTDTIPWDDYTAAGALLNGIAVCQGYADAFDTLLNTVGIPDDVVVGTTDGVGHAWNCVQLNNKWYFVDPTWDDVDNSVNQSFKQSPPSFRGSIHVPDFSSTKDLSFSYFLQSQGNMSNHIVQSNPPETDTKYDNIFEYASLLSDQGGDLYFCKSVDDSQSGTGSRSLLRRTQPKPPSNQIEIIKIDKNGDISYPFKNLTGLLNHWIPQIQDGFLYYNASEDASKVAANNIYRIPLAGGEPQFVATSAGKPILTSRYMFYVSDETVFEPGASSATIQSSLHRIDLSTLLDTKLGDGSISYNILLDGNYVYYLKYVNNNKGVVSRVALTGGTSEDLVTLDNISDINNVTNGVLTYSPGFKTIPLK